MRLQSKPIDTGYGNAVCVLNRVTKPPVHTVVETPAFARTAKRVGASAAERDALLDTLMAEPASGEVIVGGGGVRKLRLGKEETGKSGGYRVPTFYMDEDAPVYLLAIIDKSELDNISADQKKQLRTVAKAIRMSEENGTKNARRAGKAEGMSAETFADLMGGMEDVLAFEQGKKRRGYTVHSAHDIKAIRAKTKLSQPRFAEAYRLEVTAVRDWEQGRRQPERSAQVLLELIDREPETVRRILAEARAEPVRAACAFCKY